MSRVGTRLGLLRPGAPFEELHDAMVDLTPQRAAAFREVDGELTSPAFWRRYLRLDPLECGVVPAEVATVESEAPLIPEVALG